MGETDDWSAWLAEVTADVQDLAFARIVYRNLGEIVQANPQIQKPSHFYDYLRRTYATHIAMGIRRQIDIGRNTHSLRRLLQNIAKKPEYLSLDRYLDLCLSDGQRPELVDVRRRIVTLEFEKRNGKGATCFNKERAIDDENRLVELAEGVKAHVDANIAHAGKAKPDHPATFGELNAALDTLIELVSDYRLELEAVGFEPVPVLQGPWLEIFRVPWIDDGED